MKKIFKYMIVGLVACTTLSSCLESSLDTNPTDSMSGSGLLANANAALVPLNGLYRSMYSAWSPTDNTHQCFGISAYNLMADVMGEDMIMAAMGSGWFWYDCLYNVKSRYTATTWRSYDLWNCYYTWISNANYILDAEETMAGTETEVNYIMGQAYAIRAYSYFMLAQSFARTYKGHEDEPCCPIYVEPTVAGTEGKPRSTVLETYAQIMNDINKAVERLNGTTRKHISHIDYATALGLQARIALVMEDWATAKKSSEEAIAVSKCTIAKVSEFKGLNSVSAPNVMWGGQKSYLTKAVCMQVCSHTWMQMPINTEQKPANRSTKICMEKWERKTNGWSGGTRKMPTIKMVVISRKNLSFPISKLGWEIMFGCV